MSDDVVYDLIRNTLAAQWTATAVAQENEAFVLPTAGDPPEPAPFLRWDLTGTLYGQVSIGAGTTRGNLWREDGTLLLHILTPAGTGGREARRLLRLAMDIFIGQDIGVLTFGDGQAVGSGSDDDGNYFIVTGSVDWRRDT